MQAKTFLLSLLMTLGAGFNSEKVVAQSTDRPIKNFRVFYHQEHVWYVYSCGDRLYFNYDLIDKRGDTTSGLRLVWQTHQNLVDIFYCNRLGFPVENVELAPNSQIDLLTLSDRVELFYVDRLTQDLKKITYNLEIPSEPRLAKWQNSITVLKRFGAATKFDVLDLGERQTLLSYRGQTLSYFDLLSATRLWNRNLGFTLDGLTYDSASNLLYLLGRDDLVRTLDLSLFRPQLNETQINLKNESEALEAAYSPFNLGGILKKLEWRRSGGDIVQAPLACTLKKGCYLFNFYFRHNQPVLRSAANALHVEYAGRVVTEEISSFPVEKNNLELIGIMEGPPPVSIENILSTIKWTPPEFQESAILGVSRHIKTTLNQSLKWSQTVGQEKEASNMFSVGTKLGNALTPLSGSAVFSLQKKILGEESLKNESTLRRSYVNEIQHEKTPEGMKVKPVGKLVFLEYDLKGYRFVFLSPSGEAMGDIPEIYSFFKTNVRPVVRQYEILGAALYPNKFPTQIIPGNLESYTNIDRRRELMRRSAELGQGSKYLSFSFNNTLDNNTGIEISTRATVLQKISQILDFSIDGSLGFSKIFSVQMGYSHQDLRSFSVENEQEKAMAIDVAMNVVLPSNDSNVSFYDFELYYLNPEERNLAELIEELEATKNESLWNSNLLSRIHPDSKPWKLSYSVSRIIKNRFLEPEASDVLSTLGRPSRLSRLPEKNEVLSKYKTLFEVYQACEQGEESSSTICSWVKSEMLQN